MKDILKILAAAAMTAIAVPAIAADEKAAIPEGIYLDGQAANQYLAKDQWIGTKVHGPDGKIIGDIEDLILNSANEVEGIIMGTGGFLGVAEKKVGVRLSALQYTEKGGKTIVTLPSATKAVLKSLPKYKRAAPKKSLWSRAMEKAKELTDKSSDTAKDAYEKAKEQAGPALEKAKQAAGEAYEKTKEAAGAAVEKAKEAAGTAMEKTGEGAKPQNQ